MNENDWKIYQQKLLKTAENLSDGVKLVDVLSKILGSSKSAAYKKISLDTKLQLDEIIAIANYFQLSLDAFLTYKSAPVPFQSDALRKMPEKPIEYLSNLQKHLNYLTQLTNVSYINLAGEVPIFHYMTFRKLFAFKLYVWNFVSWSIKTEDKQIDLEHIDKDLIIAIEKCAHTYYSFSGIEIWNIRMIDITIDQILYFIPMGIFKNKQAVLSLLSEFEEFVYHLESICNTGIKSFETQDALNKSEIKIYMNEILHTNEVIVVTSDKGDMLFTTIDTPNFIRTHEARMTSHIIKWLKKNIRHSTQISGEGEKDRIIMFKVLHEKLRAGIIKVNNLLNYYY